MGLSTIAFPAAGLMAAGIAVHPARPQTSYDQFLIAMTGNNVVD